MSCRSGKTSFESRELAVEGLIQNHIRRLHHSGKGPINVYECEECGNWHFTSRPPIIDELNDPEVIQRIKEEGRAFAWEQKLRY